MDSTPTARLRDLKIRLSVDEVAQIVQRLGNGESVRKITNPDGAHAKDTVRKIRVLLEDGQLDFVVDAQHEQTVAQAAITEGKEIGGDHWSSDAAAPGGLERTIQTVLADLPEVEWDVGALRAGGLETEQALSLMLQHDELEQRKAEWKPADLRKYVEDHLLVDYLLRYRDRLQKPPMWAAKLAAQAKAEGMVDNNRVLREIGDNVIRYQVWHGGPYREAFEQAQTVTTRSARAQKSRYGHRIDYYIGGGTGETFMPLLPMSEQG